MARQPVEKLIKRHQSAFQKKDLWYDLLSDAFEYALPQRNMYKTRQAGAKKVDRVFDSTAQAGLISFANRIQSELMPPFQRWAQLAAGPLVPSESKEAVNKQLEEVNEKLFAVLQSSNFDNANNEVLLELGIGTGAMLVLEGELDQIVNYIPVPLEQIALEEGPWGGVSAVFRKHKVAVRNIEEQWPDAKLPDVLQRKVTASPDEEIELMEMSYQARGEMRWYYDVIHAGEKVRLVEREYHEQPWITPRWIKVAGETLGRGPVIQALPDIKTVNKIVELVLKNAALHISGVYTGRDDGVLNPNTVVISPGAVIAVRDNAGPRGPSLMPLPRSGSFDLAQLKYQETVAAIKRLLLDNRLPPDAGPVRSATEIVERVKELVQDIGAPFGRLMTEYITPLINRTLGIMQRKGIIQPIKVNGLTVQIQVVSPLAQVQNMNDVEAIIRWLSIIGSYGQELLYLSAKVEDIGPELGRKLGVPSKFIRSVDEREALQKMAGALAAQQAQPVATGSPVNPASATVAAGAAGLSLAA